MAEVLDVGLSPDEMQAIAARNELRRQLAEGLPDTLTYADGVLTHTNKEGKRRELARDMTLETWRLFRTLLEEPGQGFEDVNALLQEISELKREAIKAG